MLLRDVRCAACAHACVQPGVRLLAPHLGCSARPERCASLNWGSAAAVAAAAPLLLLLLLLLLSPALLVAGCLHSLQPASQPGA